MLAWLAQPGTKCHKVTTQALESAAWWTYRSYQELQILQNAVDPLSVWMMWIFCNFTKFEVSLYASKNVIPVCKSTAS